MTRYALFFVAFILMFLAGCGDAVSVAESTEVVAVVGGETAIFPSPSPTISPPAPSRHRLLLRTRPSLPIRHLLHPL